MGDTLQESSGKGNIVIGGDVGAGAAVGAGASVQAENIAGRDLVVNTQAETAEDAFAKIFEAIEAKAAEDSQMAQNAKKAVEVIQTENEKGEEASETSLNFSFDMLAQMAPDIFEVVVATLVNPIHGISTVVRKIAEKARADSGQEATAA